MVLPGLLENETVAMIVLPCIAAITLHLFDLPSVGDRNMGYQCPGAYHRTFLLVEAAFALSDVVVNDTTNVVRYRPQILFGCYFQEFYFPQYRTGNWWKDWLQLQILCSGPIMAFRGATGRLLCLSAAEKIIFLTGNIFD